MRPILALRVGVAALCLGVVAGSACVFSAGVPRDAQIRCLADEECPPPLACNATFHACRARSDDVIAPGIASIHVDPALGTKDTAFDVDAVFSEPLAVQPELTFAVAAGVRALTVSSCDASITSCHARVTIIGDEVPAALAAQVVFLPITATLADRAGNVADNVQTGASIAVELTPPDVVTGKTQWFLTPPAGSSARFGTRVVPGTVGDLTFEASEALASAPALHVRPAGDDAADVAVFAAPDLVDDANHVWHASLPVDEALPLGSYDIVADLVDLAGNRASPVIALPAPGFVVEAVLPSPCVWHVDGAPVFTDFDGDGVLGCADNDADGHAECPDDADCDDDDPLVFPGMHEIAGDGRGNSCDGTGDAEVVEQNGVFVAADATTTGDGSRAAPMTIDKALADGRPLFLARGDYTVSSVFTTRTDIVGGFDPSTWTRSRGDRSHIHVGDGGQIVPFADDGFGRLGIVGLDVDGDGGDASGPLMQIGALSPDALFFVDDCDFHQGPRQSLLVEGTATFAHSTIDGASFEGHDTVVDCTLTNSAFPFGFSTVIRSVVTTDDTLALSGVAVSSVLTAASGFSNGPTAFVYSTVDLGNAAAFNPSEVDFFDSIISSRFESIVSRSDGAAQPSRFIGNVWSPHVCLVLDNGVGCRAGDPAVGDPDVDACAFDGCIAAHDNVYEAAFLDDDGVHLRPDSLARGAAVSLDGFAIPTAAAADIDGDCRPVTGGDLGADEVTP